MRKLYIAIMSGFLVLSCGESSFGQDTALPLASLSTFNYKGAFNINHTIMYGNYDIKYSSAVFELSTDKKSFFFGGRKVDTTIGQFQLPKLVKTLNKADLNSAGVIQNLNSLIGTKSSDTPFDGSRIPTGNPQDIDRITGIALTKNNTLVANVSTYYDADTPNTHTTILVNNPFDLANSQIYGFFSYEGEAHMSGWISEIPDEWQRLTRQQSL